MNSTRRRRLEPALSGSGPLAAQFVNAQAQGLTIASNSTLQMATTDWAVVGWAKFNSTSAYRRLVGKVDGANFDWGVQLNPTGAAGSPNIEAFTLGGNAGSGAVTAGVWYFFCVQFTFGITSLSISLNNGAPGSNVGLVTNTTAAFGIGNNGDVSGTSGQDGLIEAVGIWKRNLTGSEVTAIYNSGLAVRMSTLSGAYLTNLVSVYDFNNRGNIGLDGFGTNHLVNQNGVTVAAGLT